MLVPSSVLSCHEGVVHQPEHKDSQFQKSFHQFHGVSPRIPGHCTRDWNCHLPRCNGLAHPKFNFGELDFCLIKIRLNQCLVIQTSSPYK